MAISSRPGVIFAHTHTLKHATRAPNEMSGSMTLSARDGDGMSGMRASAGYMGTMASGSRIPMSCAFNATERQRLPPAESPARHTVSAVLPARVMGGHAILPNMDKKGNNTCSSS